MAITLASAPLIRNFDGSIKSINQRFTAQFENKMNAIEVLELIKDKKEMQNALENAISVAYTLGFDSVAAELELLEEKFTLFREARENEYISEVLGK